MSEKENKHMEPRRNEVGPIRTMEEFDIQLDPEEDSLDQY